MSKLETYDNKIIKPFDNDSQKGKKNLSVSFEPYDGGQQFIIPAASAVSAPYVFLTFLGQDNEDVP